MLLAITSKHEIVAVEYDQMPKIPNNGFLTLFSSFMSALDEFCLIWYGLMIQIFYRICSSKICTKQAEKYKFRILCIFWVSFTLKSYSSIKLLCHGH